MTDDDPNLLNTHFIDSPRFVRPDVTFQQRRVGGPTELHLNGEPVLYAILRDGISVQRLGSANILTLSFIVGHVDMDAKPRPDDKETTP